MPRDPHKKRNVMERKVQRQDAPELPAPYSQHSLEDAAHDEQVSDCRTPFYDDPNHVAYGWQQMATLPDFPGLHTLVRGVQDDAPIDSGSRPQTWPVDEYQRVAEKGPSGFNPHPRRGKGPRRPPPLPESRVQSEQRRATRGAFRPFLDSRSNEPDTISAEGEDSKTSRARLVLSSKDVNQKLQCHEAEQSAPPFSILTENLPKVESRSRAKNPMEHEIESSWHAATDTERMPSLLEEPAPLRIEKRRTSTRSTFILQPGTFAHVRMLRANQQNEETIQPTVWQPKPTPSKLGRNDNTGAAPGHNREDVKVTDCEVDEIENDTMDSLNNSLEAAITSWHISTATEAPVQDLERRSAVPMPLNVAAIRAAKEGRRLAESKTSSDVDINREYQSNLTQVKTESVTSFATGMSSDFENLSQSDGKEAEHNGTTRKWYRGFRRSG